MRYWPWNSEAYAGSGNDWLELWGPWSLRVENRQIWKISIFLLNTPEKSNKDTNNLMFWKKATSLKRFLFFLSIYVRFQGCIEGQFVKTLVPKWVAENFSDRTSPLFQVFCGRNFRGTLCRILSRPWILLRESEFSSHGAALGATIWTFHRVPNGSL